MNRVNSHPECCQYPVYLLTGLGDSDCLPPRCRRPLLSACGDTERLLTSDLCLGGGSADSDLEGDLFPRPFCFTIGSGDAEGEGDRLPRLTFSFLDCSPLPLVSNRRAGGEAEDEC